MSVGRYFDNHTPLRVVNSTPGVGVPGKRKPGVIVDHKALDWEDDQKHGEVEEEKAQESRLVHPAV